MISQLCSAVAAGAAVLTYAVVATPATAPVANQGPTSGVAKSAGEVGKVSAAVPHATDGRVLPYNGHYMGSDTHRRAVRFFMHNNRITHFMVNHTRFPDAHVSGHQWHHTCADSVCTRGMWTSDTTVEGRWNDTRQAGDVHFTAHLVSH